MSLRALLAALFFLFAASLGHGAEIYGASTGDLDFYAGDLLLNQWRVPEAREAIDRILARNPALPAARLADAHVAFFEGDYERSLKVLDSLGQKGSFRELVRNTREATKGMKSKKSQNFEIFWLDPRDEILADEGLLALEAERSVLAGELGYAPKERVRVEIYATPGDFTAASTLTRREVDTTGIVGLCKFDRLMITTPRAALWGYRWRDTLCHEYAHLVIYRLSRGEAPIWVHEGVAKYLEGAWRARKGRLEPSSLALLTQRSAKGTLIPLEKMSPSIAKLPSAEDAQLAFAQVASMMEFLVSQRGAKSLERLVEPLSRGVSDRQSLADVWGGPFEDFEGRWKKWVAELPRANSDIEVVAVELKGQREDSEADPTGIASREARDFVLLGDMLRGRERFTASAVEYEKAYGFAPKSPTVVSRHALGRIFVKDYQGAVKAVDGVLDLYEDMAVLWSRKGDALLLMEKYAESRDAYLELLEINPFHLPGRAGLLEAARKLGDEKLAAREEAYLHLLAGQTDEKNPHQLQGGNGKEAGKK